MSDRRCKALWMKKGHVHGVIGIGIKLPPTLCVAKMNIYDGRYVCYDSTSGCYDVKLIEDNAMIAIAICV